MSGDLIFVYGTLRKDSGSDMSRLLRRCSDFVADATFRGVLYRVGPYPGVTFSLHAHDRVHGEVYRLHDADRALAILDEYEGCRDGRSDNEYVRRAEAVTLKGGTNVPAWVYVYARPTAGLERILSGDYFSHERV